MPRRRTKGMREKYFRDAYAASRCRNDRSNPRNVHEVLRRMLRRMAIHLRYDGFSRRAVRRSVAECKHARFGNEEPHHHRRSHCGNERTDHDVVHLKSHHSNTSLLYLEQNLFHKNKESRTISLNSQYMMVFKNPRDASQMSQLVPQVYPGCVKFLTKGFQRCHVGTVRLSIVRSQTGHARVYASAHDHLSRKRPSEWIVSSFALRLNWRRDTFNTYRPRIDTRAPN